ncbi:proteasome assembly chaperone family protein [Candidatus Parvarchaeota archaeon]|nr:proteasome assembly chaperone family protein [Candidatus Parvarchaeota archaeon]
MIETKIYQKKNVKMKNPILVEGLPGIGLVGKLAADHMIKEFKAQKVAELVSPHFPHQVLMQKNGIMRMLKNKFYLIPGKKNDVLILVGDVQAVTSEAQYEICGKMLDYFEKKGGKLIYTLGGYGTGKAPQKPQVFGSATHKEIIPAHEKAGMVFGKSHGSIIGAAGLLLGMGKFRGMKGVCIMGETHGGYVDARAAQALLEVLSRLLGVKIDPAKLEQRAKEGEAFMKKMEKEASKQKETMPGSSAKELSYIR